MASNRRNSGFTLIELLIVIGIVGIVLLTLTSYFRMQTAAATQNQAQNEVEGKLRSVSEVIMQDLQLAGSRAIFDGTFVTYLDLRQTPEPDDPSSEEWATWKREQCSGAHRDGCVTIGQGGVDISIYYGTSLDRGGQQCRRIDYLLDDDGQLFRRDVSCGDTSTSFDGFLFASEIDDITVTFICHDPDNAVPNISDCYTATTYPREATVTVEGHAADTRRDITSQVQLATSLPNLRPPVDYLDL